MATNERPGKDLGDLWRKRIAKDEKAHGDWRKEAERVQKIHDQESDEGTKGNQSFNVLWSNTQIQHGALYSNTAKPDIRKRYTDTQGPAKEASQLLERAIMYCQDMTDFDGAIDCVVDDSLVAGLGLPRVKLDVETGPVVGPDGQPVMGADGKPAEQVQSIMVMVEHVPWSSFGWEPVQRWSDVDWAFIKHKKRREDIEKRYGVKLTEKDGKELPDMVDLYECFDKRKKEIVILADGEEKPLKVIPDTLKLKDFYPFPKPIIFYEKSKSFTPRPEYIFYEPQADSLDQITKRIKAITKAIKEVGVYDSSLSEKLGTVSKQADGTFVPIDGLMAKLNGNDWRNVLATLPMDDKIKVLEVLSAQQAAEKEEIYELTGISDIVRGSTSASESATAQSMKGHYADMRFARKRKAVNWCIRGTFRIMSELLAEHAPAEVLTKMTGVEVTPEIDALLRDEVARNFTIDVETDSTIAADENNEREQKLTFLKTVTEYLNQLLPAIQGGAMPLELAKEVLLMVVSGWKYGRSLEDYINAIGDENSPEQQVMMLQQQLQQCQQQMAEMQAQSQQIGQQMQAVQQENAAMKEQINTGELMKNQADAQLKHAQAQKTTVEAQRLASTPVLPEAV